MDTTLTEGTASLTLCLPTSLSHCKRSPGLQNFEVLDDMSFFLFSFSGHVDGHTHI